MRYLRIFSSLKFIFRFIKWVKVSVDFFFVGVSYFDLLVQLADLLKVILGILFAAIDGFNSDAIRLQSQKSEVLQILIYTRLKINRK